MADNYLITGYWGEPHVTPENDRGINASIFGTGRFVLPVGEQFKAEYIGNNTVRVYDGKLMNNGAAAGIPAGKYVDLLIPEAGQGMKRNDLIVFQYEKDVSTLVESGIFAVVKGEETSGTAADPALTQADILSDEANFDQMALWRVAVSGAVISTPVKLFSVATNAPDHIKNKSNPHSVTKAQVGLGNVQNVSTNNQTPTYSDATKLETLVSGEKLSTAFGKIKLAITNLISHLSNKDNPHGVTAAQAGARPSSWTPTYSDVGAAAAGHNHAGGSIVPATIELTPGTSAGHGGFIDFHYNGSTKDYTSRIIEASSGTLTLNGNKMLTAANIIAVYNETVTFSDGKATYENSMITSQSVCIVQRRSGTAGTATTSMFATTSANGKLTIVTENTAATLMNLNILILNL